ncbi:putative dol-P-Man:Man(6)GlcNAc(2)-PP-Dol alpha-1,2-mannosyltransferase-like [Capsicum annuum]|nr:putative dol-P-Man:Man(6)GlcNAc(2)-PP-Dol alpha-1,2-mannosyltransferase-like [Capsicum annuum]
MASNFNSLQFLPVLKTQLPFISPPTTLIPHTKLVVNGRSTLSGHVTISGSKNSALPILAATLCCSGSYKLEHAPYLSDTKLVINGSGSVSTLSGHVTISGSKNSALPILAATLCCSGSSKLKNVPCLLDTRTMVSILESLGARVSCFGEDIVVNTDGVMCIEPDLNEVRKVRGGFFVIGPLLARYGEATVGLPGGCDIGARPVDIYIHGLRSLGATVELRDGKVQAHVSNGKGLTGASFRLAYPSVGATETLMMAECLAKGKTVISNAAQEPEIVDLAGFLTNCGAVVEGAGTDTLYITGRRRLCGSEYSIMPDRIEAGTYMLATAITRSCISISHVSHSNLTCLIDKLSGAGCKILQLSDDTLEISAVPRTIGDDLWGFSIKTNPFPGFPTDLQPLTMALLSTCKAKASLRNLSLKIIIVLDSLKDFIDLLYAVTELQKFGAKIQVCGSKAVVSGEGNASPLRGSQVIAADLRGGMSLVLAGLAAEGTTDISGISHVDRGYESLEMKLQGLGANVTRTTS